MADDLVRELLADLLHDTAKHPPAGIDGRRCRRLARVLRTEGAPARAVEAATAEALRLARLEGAHRAAWVVMGARLVAGEARRWQAGLLLHQWTEPTG